MSATLHDSQYITDFRNTKKLLQNFYKNCKFMKHVLAIIEVTLSIFLKWLTNKSADKKWQKGDTYHWRRNVDEPIGKKRSDAQEYNVA